MNRSYASTAERMTIWDGNALTSPRRRKRSKLLLLRRRKKTMLPTIGPPVMMTTAASIGQRRTPQAGI